MNMTRGDILDRWTILRMKARIDYDARMEMLQYDSELYLLVGSPEWEANKARMIDLVAQLQEANSKIWVLESDMRRDKRPMDSLDPVTLAEYGRRALEIRDYNKLRVAARNEINKIFGDAQDKKVEHASQ